MKDENSNKENKQPNVETPRPPQVMDASRPPDVTNEEQPQKNESEKKVSKEQKEKSDHEKGQPSEKKKLLGESPIEIDDETTI